MIWRYSMIQKYFEIVYIEDPAIESSDNIEQSAWKTKWRTMEKQERTHVFACQYGGETIHLMRSVYLVSCYRPWRFSSTPTKFHPKSTRTYILYLYTRYNNH